MIDRERIFCRRLTYRHVEHRPHISQFLYRGDRHLEVRKTRKKFTAFP